MDTRADKRTPNDIKVTTERDGDAVKVTAVLPHTRSRVTITIDVAPSEREEADRPRRTSTAGAAGRAGGRADAPDTLPELRIANGRPIGQLLFATNRGRLAKNIGRLETDHVLAGIKAAGHDMVELTGDEGPAAAQAHMVGNAINRHQGIVILGGYDVVPPLSFDALEPALREQMTDSGDINADADYYIVWSDAPYGDKDGDGLPELPVSRIPDGMSADLVFTAIQAAAPTPGRRFGVRNEVRPFAAGVYGSIEGPEALLVSQATEPHMIPDGTLDVDAVYLVLHGAHNDGTRFWGETDDGLLEAINVANIGGTCRAVVFSGCCWGALAAEPPAAGMSRGGAFRPRTANTSMALAFLNAGALAFIGCTGSHYSPVQEPYNYVGGPMHAAFWRQYACGKAPALALFDAKKEYLAGIPHGHPDINNRAKEMKILREFTCLGLGW